MSPGSPNTITTKLSRAIRAICAFIRSSPWFVPVAAILALLFVVTL